MRSTLVAYFFSSVSTASDTDDEPPTTWMVGGLIRASSVLIDAGKLPRKTGSPTSNGGPITWNFKMLSHHLLDGFGGMGEGMSIQTAPDGRRILWLAHESAPKNFTAVDVSDPRKPKVVVQTDLPQAHMRSNSLETCGNLMAVAYQTQKKGQQPAGMELFDISVPEKPKSISFFDCSGETSRAA